MFDAPAVMTGFLRRDGQRLVGAVVDVLGYVTHIVGEPEIIRDDGVQGWAITAVVTEPADRLRPMEKKSSPR